MQDTILLAHLEPTETYFFGFATPGLRGVGATAGAAAVGAGAGTNSFFAESGILSAFATSSASCHISVSFKTPLKLGIPVKRIQFTTFQ